MLDPSAVAVLAFPEVAIFELAVACEVFGVDRSDMELPNYKLWICGVEPGPIRVKGGLMDIEAPYGLDQAKRAGTLVVPAGPVNTMRLAPALVDTVRTAYQAGARILSICSGAFILAAAGLLDGRRATTHWMYTTQLAERYPSVRVDPKVLWVEDGTIFTSAGTAAGIDLCLHIVRLDHGAEVANMFARRMVVPPYRDGGQAQYVEMPMPVTLVDMGLGDALDWMRSHLSEELSVEDLARRAHMSPRTFARRFLAVTGATPHQWLLSQRVFYAQQLLETTDLAVEVVARRSGLGSPATMRQHFQRQLSTSPQAYRRTFRREGAA